jgi:1,4-alpha-glucan branching enzyme
MEVETIGLLLCSELWQIERRQFMSPTHRKPQASRIQSKLDSVSSDKLSLPVQAAAKKVRFETRAEPGSKVFVAGTFNNWDPGKDELKEKDDLYSASLLLPVGRHEYKFVVDGNWHIDPNCPEWVPNEVGSLNSVVTVA